MRFLRLFRFVKNIFKVRFASIGALSACVIFLLAVFPLASQNLIRSSFQMINNASPTVRLGVIGGGNFSLHFPNFNTVPGYATTFLLPYVPDNSLQSDQTFRSNVAVSPILGGLLEIPLSEQLYLSVRGAYTSHSGEVRATQRFYDALSDEIFALDHTLSFSYSTLSAEIGTIWKPLEALPNLVFGLGVQGSLGMDSRVFVQNSGSELVAVNGMLRLPIKPNVRGDLPSESLVLSGFASIGYELPVLLGLQGVAGRLLFTPELSVVAGLTNIVGGFVGGDSWRMVQIRPQLALKYEFPRSFERMEEYERIDTVRIVQTRESLTMTSIPDTLRKGIVTQKQDKEFFGNLQSLVTVRYRTDTLISTKVIVQKPTMRFSLVTMGVQPDGKEVAVPEIRIEEIIGQTYTPLLNYIFFAEGSSELPVRYVRLQSEGVRSFSLEHLKHGTDELFIYHNILNVLGSRLKQMPEATITLTGCTSGSSAEQGKIALAEARAKSVKQYLCDVWGIAAERISTKARLLPEKPSLPLTESDKREENRRVEISTSKPELLGWVVLADTVRTATPPKVRIITQVETETPPSAWRLAITHEGDTLRTFDSTGQPPQILDWDFAKEARMQGRDLATLTAPFILYPALRDSIGNTHTSEAAQLPIRQLTVQKKRRERRKDKEFEQFSMMLFEFNDSRPSAAQESAVKFIQGHLKPLSELTVIGYTDRTGSPEYNRTLSLERAQQIARMISGEENLSEQVFVRGLGNSELLFDNSVPEGRFYSRTVRVLVETPVFK